MFNKKKTITIFVVGFMILFSCFGCGNLSEERRNEILSDKTITKVSKNNYKAVAVLDDEIIPAFYWDINEVIDKKTEKKHDELVPMGNWQLFNKTLHSTKTGYHSIGMRFNNLAYDCDLSELKAVLNNGKTIRLTNGVNGIKFDDFKKDTNIWTTNFSIPYEWDSIKESISKIYLYVTVYWDEFNDSGIYAMLLDI